MALINCPECGRQISDKATNCPNCGCPIHVANYSRTQQVEIANVSSGMSNKLKKIGIVSLFVIIAIVAAVFVVLKIKDAKKQAALEAQMREYKANLQQVCTKMLSGARDAEEYGGLLHDVWYNTIYEEDDYKTDKYTKNGNGVFWDDFNDAIMMLQFDDDYQEAIEGIQDNQAEVEKLMKSLKNPPEEYKEAYESAKVYYDAYLELTNLAISPSGNLNSYTSSFNEADTKVANAYKKIQMYLD